MAELTLSAADIAAALTKNLEGFTPSLEARTVGRVAEVGDGIARVLGPARRRRQRAARVRGRHRSASPSTSTRTRSAPSCSATSTRSRRARPSSRPAASSPFPVGDGVLGRVVNALGEPVDGKGELVGVQQRRMEIQAPGIMGRKPVARAAADRHQGDRRDDADRARPARADHRRPQDRQDDDRRRHDPEPEGSGREVHLRGDRPEGLDGRPDRGDAAPERGDGLHGRRDGAGRRPGAVQVPRPLRRLRDGPALDGERRARPRRLRRPVEAGRGLPPGVAAAAPPAGPRGLPGRRLLPPQPPAGAGGQAVRRERGRLADRAADHRDQGRRHLGLHPDQRDLDHRRPGVRAGRPVQVRRAPGRRRRQLGVPRRWRGPDQVDEGASPAR